MPAPCHGLRVIDFTQSYPGALATMVLADAGAEVIKVERPGGDPTRRHYAWVMWHRGKQSVVLDLKTPEGAAQGKALAATADVVIESFRPGVAERLGVGYAALAKGNPGLVYCGISGFGAKGPWAKLKGYEHLVQAISGRFDGYYGVAEKDGPLYAAQPLGSYAAAMLAVQGMLAALRVRRRTGEGQRVDVSLLQAITCYDLNQFVAWQILERMGTPVRRGYTGPVPPYMTVRTKDGYWLQMANLTPNLLWNFLHQIGLEEMLSDPRFATMPTFKNPEDEIAALRMIWPKMLHKTRDEWMRIFMENDIAGEPFRTTQEGLLHDQAVHNGNVIEREDPRVGRTKQLGVIGKLSATPLTPGKPAPNAGEHTRAVLEEPAGMRHMPQGGKGKLPNHPLEGVTVLELASYIATPFATALLADMGARVIKIEPLTGDLYRTSFPRMGKTLQGKEAIALDLKEPRAQEIMHKLIAKADILLHNYRPGVPERLGIGYETARKINPRLIYVYAGAYGSNGPHMTRAGFHPIAGAITGGPRLELGPLYPDPKQPMTLAEIEKTAEMLRRSNEPNPDPVTALATTAAVMLALYARETTGEGQYVELSMLGGNLYAHADDAVWYAGKPERAQPDAGLNGVRALYRMYRAKEDGWVFVACETEQEWRAFAGAAGLAQLTEDARFHAAAARAQHDAALVEAVAKAMTARTAEEWQARMASHDAPCVAVSPQDMGKLYNTAAWLKDAGYWVETSHPSLGGSYWRYGPAVQFSKTPGTAGPMNYLGEHTRPVLRELGYSEGQIGEMAQAGMIVCHEAAKGLQ